MHNTLKHLFGQRKKEVTSVKESIESVTDNDKYFEKPDKVFIGGYKKK
jgi:hypothetical protein